MFMASWISPSPGAGFGFYFLASRATAYAKYPGEKNWLFDENFKPLVNNPAFVRAIQDVVDALPSEPPDQINADGNTTAFQQFLPGTGALLEWWGDIGTMARTSDASVIADVLDFDILPASDDVYNFRKGAWEKLPTGPNVAPNMAYLGWGIYVMKTVDSDEKRHKAAWSAAAHLGGKDLSMWTAAYPSGFQPYRKSHTNLDLWALAGYDKTLYRPLYVLAVDLLQPPELGNRASHSRYFPILQHRRRRTQQGLCGQGDRPARRRQCRGRLGEADRQARS